MAKELISFDEARKLLEKYVGDKPGIVAHCEAAAAYAYEIAKKISEKHSELGVDVEKTRVITLLHDIGRGENARRHHLVGRDILLREGLTELGASVARHGCAYEDAFLEDFDEKEFLPKSIEEKIMVYADLHAMHDKIVSLEERIRDVRKRNEGNPELLKRFQTSKKRMLRLMKEVEDLMK